MHREMRVARGLRRPDGYVRWSTCPDCKASNSEKLLPRQTKIGGIRHAMGCRSVTVIG